MVNNAGVVGVTGSIATTPLADWERTIAILQTSVFLGTKHAFAVMKAQGHGSIINTSSTAGVQGGLGAHAYTTAKHAVIGLTKSVAVEAAPHRVRVNVLCPGATLSSLTAGVVTGDRDNLDARIRAPVLEVCRRSRAEAGGHGERGAVHGERRVGVHERRRAGDRRRQGDVLSDRAAKFYPIES